MRLLLSGAIGLLIGGIAGYCLLMLFIVVQEGWGWWIDNNFMNQIVIQFIGKYLLPVSSAFYFVFRFGLGRLSRYDIRISLILNLIFTIVIGLPVGFILGGFLVELLNGNVYSTTSKVGSIVGSVILSSILVYFLAIKQYIQARSL